MSGDWRVGESRAVSAAGLVREALTPLFRQLEAERDRFFLWVPVFLGAGTGAYFALAEEPTIAFAVAPLMAAIGLFLLLRSRPLGCVLALAAICAAVGFANVKLRALWVDSPSLLRSTKVVHVVGWVEDVAPKPKKGARLTLRLISIDGIPEEQLPFRARVTARFAEMGVKTGDAVRLRAVLRPVPEPVAPGGFDFARKAWFERLGAVGFAIGPPTVIADAAPPPFGLRLWAGIDSLRQTIGNRIRAALPGPSGTIATALITGERTAIPEDTLSALRHSGLAHVLAISGLHMALMAGTLFWLVRASLALIPSLALRYAIKKWAAFLALVGAAFYLALSGAGIATQRAFIMMAIFFLAIMLDRPALTLRNVAIAALIILLTLPESVLNVSFQMSFAAVVGLVSVYETATSRRRNALDAGILGNGMARAWRYFAGIGLTTLVASLATAPFAAFHFHKLAQFSLLGNLAAMPLVGILIMPMALLALLAMPFGLEAGPLWIMAQGIEFLTAVAGYVSGLDGAVVHVAAMPTHALVLLVVGGLWLCLWRRPWRSAGLIIAAIGVAIAGNLPRPDVLIEREGKTLAVRTDKGLLAIPTAQRVTYSIDKWLLADGDGTVADLGKRTGAYRCDEHACVATVKGQAITFLRHPAALREECRRADIIVSQFPFRRRCPKARVIVDKLDFRREGAHAVYLEGEKIRVETVSQRRGSRPWVRSKPAQRKLREDRKRSMGRGR